MRLLADGKARDHPDHKVEHVLPIRAAPNRGGLVEQKEQVHGVFAAYRIDLSGISKEILQIGFIEVEPVLTNTVQRVAYGAYNIGYPSIFHKVSCVLESTTLGRLKLIQPQCLTRRCLEQALV